MTIAAELVYLFCCMSKDTSDHHFIGSIIFSFPIFFLADISRSCRIMRLDLWKSNLETEQR